MAKTTATNVLLIATGVIGDGGGRDGGRGVVGGDRLAVHETA